MQSFKAIGQWILKIFEAVPKLVHEFRCILMLSKSKKGHTLVKVLDRAIISWSVVVLMNANKCAKFQSNRSMDVENIWSGTNTCTWISVYFHAFQCISMLTKSTMVHNLVKMLDRVIISRSVVVLILMNKCAKFQSNRSMDFENIWGDTQTCIYHYADADTRVTTIFSSPFSSNSRA